MGRRGERGVDAPGAAGGAAIGAPRTAEATGSLPSTPPRHRGQAI